MTQCRDYIRLLGPCYKSVLHLTVTTDTLTQLQTNSFQRALQLLNYRPRQEPSQMPRFTSPLDGAQLFYRDYKPIPTDNSEQTNGHTKPTLVFLHGWPYSSLAWEVHTVQLCVNHGYRCIAPDRRGFGKSDWDGPQSDAIITYETFAQDTVHLLEKFLDVGPFVFITASMGAGESILALEASEYIRKNCKVCTRPPSTMAAT